MQHQTIALPSRYGLRAIYQFSRLVVLGLRILDVVVLVFFAATVFYLLETVLP